MVKRVIDALVRAGKGLFRCWRVLATGLCFLVFYLTSLLVSVLVVPANRLLTNRPEERRARMRSLTRCWFKLFLGLMKRVGVVGGVNVAGTPDFGRDEARLIVANHPTLIDVIAALSRLPQVVCVVKTEIWESPFMGRIVKACGYIPNRSALSVYERTRQELEDGRSVLFFPEGTRSPAHGIRSFSRVVGQIAVSTECRVVPLTIECNVSTLRKDQAWYDVPPEPLEMTLTFRSFRYRGSSRNGSVRKRSRDYTRTLETFYRHWLNLGPGPSSCAGSSGEVPVSLSYEGDEDDG